LPKIYTAEKSILRFYDNCHQFGKLIHSKGKQVNTVSPQTSLIVAKTFFVIFKTNDKFSIQRTKKRKEEEDKPKKQEGRHKHGNLASALLTIRDKSCLVPIVIFDFFKG
jgi:hypothetical protein